MIISSSNSGIRCRRLSSRLPRQGVDRDIDVPGKQACFEHHGRIVDDDKVHVRPSLAELAHQPQKALRRESTHDAEIERVVLHLDRTRRFRLDLVGTRRDLLKIRQHDVAEFGQVCPRSFTAEQISAKIRLQQLDCLDQRRRADVAFFRRTREVQCRDNSQEVSDLMHFHGYVSRTAHSGLLVSQRLRRHIPLANAPVFRPVSI